MKPGHKKRPSALGSIYNRNHKKPLYINIGGTAWESNPANLARRSQAVLKFASTCFSSIFMYSEVLINQGFLLSSIFM